MITQIRGDLTISADGEVKAVVLDNVRDPKFRQFLIDKIASWEFYPVAVNGKGIEATVPFDFNLIATSDSKKQLKHIEFDRIEFGQSAIEKEINGKSELKPLPKPRLSYPRRELIVGAEATIDVVVNIAADGTVSDAAIYSMSIINAAMPEARIYARNFSDEALSTVKKFRWAPHELAKYDCTGGCTATIVTEFKMADSPAWRSYQEMPVNPVPWLVASEVKNMDASEQSQLVRLKQDPTGQPLEIGG